MYYVRTVFDFPFRDVCKFGEVQCPYGSSVDTYEKGSDLDPHLSALFD
jgi:hypothetical protein